MRPCVHNIRTINFQMFVLYFYKPISSNLSVDISAIQLVSVHILHGFYIAHIFNGFDPETSFTTPYLRLAERVNTVSNVASQHEKRF